MHHPTGADTCVVGDQCDATVNNATINAVVNDVSCCLAAHHEGTDSAIASGNMFGNTAHDATTATSAMGNKC